jgi:ATP adenylyltransferase
MDRLWSPWRLPYVTRTKPEDGCVFCDAQRMPDSDSLIVHRGEHCFVILNLYPYNNGHIMVAPRKHVSTLGSLAPPELQEVALFMQQSEAALMRAYEPHGINIGVNIGKPAGAGILDHIHVHLVPRWNGDTNFMTVVSDARVLPESLADSAKRLRATFEQLGSTVQR